MNDSNLDQTSLPGKSRTMDGILKLMHAKKIELDDTFLSKSMLSSLDAPLNKNHIYPEVVKLKIKETADFYQAQIQEYAVVSLYLQNFFNMALLQYMAKALDDIKKEEQIILISEFNSLISNLIQN